MLKFSLYLMHHRKQDIVQSDRQTSCSLRCPQAQVFCGFCLQAMQWIADNVQHPAVVSASISGEYSAAVNQAVLSLINDYGISVISAAGEACSLHQHCQLTKIDRLACSITGRATVRAGLQHVLSKKSHLPSCTVSESRSMLTLHSIGICEQHASTEEEFTAWWWPPYMWHAWPSNQIVTWGDPSSFRKG